MLGVDCMARAGKVNAGCYERPGTDVYGRRVEDDAAVVDDGKPVRMDVEPVVTPEAWPAERERVAGAEELGEDGDPALGVIGVRLVMAPVEELAFVCGSCGMSSLREQ